MKSERRENPYSTAYAPDRYFMQQLKSLDKRLGCRYRVDIKCFVITWDMPIGPPAELLVVRTRSGHFRQPDQRELMALCEGDLHRTDLAHRLQQTETYMRNYREVQEKNAREDLRNKTKDDKLQLMNAYRRAFNEGHKKSAHRRMDYKPKGKVFKHDNQLGACVAS